MFTESGKEISRIGLGTWGIGGFGHRNDALTQVREDHLYIDALVRALAVGYNFTEISMAYAHGNAAKLLALAIKESGLNRRDLFVSNSIYPKDLESIEDVGGYVQGFQKLFEGYADSTLVTWTLVQKFGERFVVNLLKRMLENEQTRYVTLCNAGREGIELFIKEFGDKFAIYDGHISFEVRKLQDEGLNDLANQHGLKTTVWRPLRQNKTANLHWPLLVGLANKYGKSVNEVILSWMIKNNWLPVVMSLDPSHIEQNWQTQNFSLSDKDYKLIDDFRAKGIQIPLVDLNEPDRGVSMVALAGFNDYVVE